VPDWIRPYGVVIGGVLEFGLELAIVDGVIQDVRPHTGPAEPFVISPAFVNAHSHLEYRGMQDQIPHPEYYEWIYELSRLKPLETPEFVAAQCDLAALENRKTGVAWIGEHSDRLGSAAAMVKHGLGGWIFQEVITSGSPDIAATMRAVQARLVTNNSFLTDLYASSNPYQTLDVIDEHGPGGSQTVARASKTLGPIVESQESESRRNPVVTTAIPPIGSSLNPHAYFTVDREILRQFGASGEPSSIHVAETIHESNFTRTGTGPLAERRRSFGVPFEIYGLSVVQVLDELGVLRPGMQCVHCCDVDENDIAIMAKRGVTIAHCPRSNVRLQCPIAPVREFLDAGITVGLGMDSPASGGPIDMFTEMRSTLAVSRERGVPITAEEVWRMATSEGYKSFGKPSDEAWDIYIGSKTPLIKLHLLGGNNVSDLIKLSSPDLVSWI